MLGAASEAPAQNAAGVKARGSSRAPAAPAAPAAPMSEAALGERMNANTVAVVSGTPGGTYFRMASDMAFVLDDGDDLRILPILGKGAGQNAYDIRFLKGVDLGFVRTDTLDQLREDKRLTNVDRHITYIARLFNDELHVIAPREVTDIRQLAGKKVSFDVKGSGTDYTGRSMFKGLGLDIEAVNIDQAAAFDLLKRGELAAVVSVAAKPVAVVAGFDPGERFHVLPVPFVDVLADRYFPATLTAKDYPKLVPEGATVNTLAVGTVLGAYNWPAKRLLLEVRRVPQAPASREMARGQPRGGARELEAFPGRPGMARRPQRRPGHDGLEPRRLPALPQRSQACLRS
ncbi:MAG TPA: TAXI family TRAP transporter solute-binding subunit [Beijerinckiaceae bacterium]|nr:TAXI family TRAP transporter solute-binding subunit [Beijerinckiaceae bacterium]